MSARDLIADAIASPERGWANDLHLVKADEAIAALAAAGYKIVSREATEAQVEAIRHAMSAEKFVSHMRAIDCWAEGWHAAEPKTPSDFQLVGAPSNPTEKETQ